MNKDLLITVFGLFRIIFDVLLELTVMKRQGLYEEIKEGSAVIDGILDAMAKDDELSTHKH